MTEIASGDGTLHVFQKGQTSLIFTGAPIPSGSDTVIPQEWIKPLELLNVNTPEYREAV
ncbi:MAG TPA: hypothetical protein VK957_12120 [Lunatimonas sp.]|nr:hypothetical protein [Lunatimonas sp.]